MATTARRANRFPVLTDNPDVPRDIGNLAADLDDAPGYNTGLIAARPASGRWIGDIYWATDDTTMGPNGTPYVWTTGAWRVWAHPNDAAVGVASARTLGTGALQAASGSDSRLSDARTPTAHAASHRAGGTDPLSVNAFAALMVRDTGEVNQIRAGRQLALADFTTALGLAAPVGLYNLSSTADSSGNARTLTNKGAMTFVPGITGAATEASTWIGATTQGFYIPDAGAGDPFRIQAGSWGCWFRTNQRNPGTLMSKIATGQTVSAFELNLTFDGELAAVISFDGTTSPATVMGGTRMWDDRWHFGVATFDGDKLCIYVDGVQEAGYSLPGAIFPVAGPFNIGSKLLDSAVAGSNVFFGKIDEAFVTTDVLEEEQIRFLYAAKVAHSLGVLPTDLRVAVRKRRRGGPILTTDFPANPLRLHNFTGSPGTADQGTNGVALTMNPGTGSINIVPGADGQRTSALLFVGAHTGASATDTGLPSGTNVRSYGGWVKTADQTSFTFLAWGTVANGVSMISNAGMLQAKNAADLTPSAALSGVYIADGRWHHIVIVEDSTAADFKRKLYIDGKFVSGSATLNSITLGGAGFFRVGANSDGTSPMRGCTDGVFVTSSSLTAEQVHNLYNLGSVAKPPTPKDSGPHVEAVDTTSLYLNFDSLEGCDQIDLQVA